jgi:hypothetical protein
MVSEQSWPGSAWNRRVIRTLVGSLPEPTAAPEDLGLLVGQGEDLLLPAQTPSDLIGRC